MHVAGNLSKTYTWWSQTWDMPKATRRDPDNLVERISAEGGKEGGKGRKGRREGGKKGDEAS